MSRTLTISVLAALCCAAPAPAATTVEVKYGAVTVDGDDQPGHYAIDLLKRGKGDYVVGVSDATGPVTAGAGCTAMGANAVACAEKVATVDAGLGGGDDTVTFGASGDWHDYAVFAGAGNDRFDTTAVTSVPRAGDADVPNAVLDGGAGDDELVSGPVGDTFAGGKGSDLAHGGAGDDTLDGGGGVDSLFGEDGDDDLYVGEGDSADGGAGRDALRGSDSWTAVCGAGRDTLEVGYDEGPGPLASGDCERLLEARTSPLPTAVTRKSVSFSVTSGDRHSLYGRAELRLRWHGRTVAAKAFTTPRAPVAVKLALPSALRHALADGPQEVGVVIHGYRSTENFDDEKIDYGWRVTLTRP